MLEACTQVRTLSESIAAGQGLRVAVNISGRHLQQGNLARLRERKTLGVRLAIDDFGVGYSSLSYLHRFPIDILKIDRAFVSRMTEQNGGPEPARAVVMLGTTLGLETIAEGIENEDQATALLDLGCVAGQGFLFASSCSLAEVTRTPFMARRRSLGPLGRRLIRAPPPPGAHFGLSV